MNLFSSLITFTLLLGSLVSPINANTGTPQLSTNYVEQPSIDTNQNSNLFNVEDTDTKERVNKIDNEINNMLAGKVSPSDVGDDIFNEKFFAKERGEGMAGDELGENERFIDYLNACDEVVSAYKYEDLDLQSKINVMNEKKNLI